jgi:aryl-alcohol dehydrogenase-like predicted oxidoreductase
MMQYRPLFTNGPKVSVIGLGTMTWGEQNTEKEAHSQLDYAIEQGVTLIDTAEMYPVPPKKETYTRTESYIGSWNKLPSLRDKIFLATKASGPGLMHIRNGPKLSRPQLRHALEASLKRLNTDYVDLYQLHWPERQTNFFGRLNYEHQTNDNGWTPLLESLETLGEFVKEGRVRHIGVSNETPWGVMNFLSLAKEHGLPRMASIQNPYSLVNRTYEIGLAEISHREGVGLLAYSPMAFGVLSGKYANGQKPENGRLTLFDRFTRYNGEQTKIAVDQYIALAREHGFTPAQMSLAFVNSRPFVASTLIGATTMEQLKENIASIDLTLSDDLLASIERIHSSIPNPAP